MRSSCIPTPAKERLILIHQWQLEFCNGDAPTAALLSYFQYWHDVKLQQSERAIHENAVAEMHGDAGTQDEGLYQWHNEESLIEGIMHLAKADKVRSARKWLVDRGVISEHKNPNPRYRFDRTVHYLFHPEVILQWLDTRNVGDRSQETSECDNRNIGDRQQENLSLSPESRSPSPINPSPSQENLPAIPKTTTEISSKTSTGTSGKPVSKNRDVVDVFEHWQITLGHKRAVLDEKRSVSIRKMLKAGYTVQDLKDAITGCGYSKFHMGFNDRNQRYDSIDLIFRSADQVDKFIAYCECPPDEYSSQTKQNISEAMRFLEN